MEAFFVWLASLSPVLAKLLNREPQPTPPDPSKPAVDAGDDAARGAAKKRAEGTPPP